jgi:hypothetical protein
MWLAKGYFPSMQAKSNTPALAFFSFPPFKFSIFFIQISLPIFPNM